MALQILGIDAHHDFQIVFEPVEHSDFIVRCEAGENTRGMHIVEELAAHFEVELAAFTCDVCAPLLNVSGLHFDVLLAVKTDSLSHGALSEVVSVWERARDCEILLCPW